MTTTTAARARCAGCGQLRGLRADGTLRRHRDGAVACPGSKRLPSDDHTPATAPAESTGARAEAEQILAADQAPSDLPEPGRQLDQILDPDPTLVYVAQLYEELVVELGVDPARIPTVDDDQLAWQRVLEAAGVAAAAMTPTDAGRAAVAALQQLEGLPDPDEDHLVHAVETTGELDLGQIQGGST